MDRDPGAAGRLARAHVGYARALAARIHQEIEGGVELDDLVGYANRGLMEAAARFDPRRGVAFKTFAWYRIRGAVYDGLRETGWLTRPEHRRLRLAAGANRYLQSLAARDGGGQGASRRTAEQEVAAVRAAIDGLAAIALVSLEHTEPEGVIDPQASGPEDAADAGRLRAALARLPARERRLLVEHYYQGRTLDEAGRRQKLSRSWASRLHARAVERLAVELGAAARHGASGPAGARARSPRRRGR